MRIQFTTVPKVANAGTIRFSRQPHGSSANKTIHFHHHVTLHRIHSNEMIPTTSSQANPITLARTNRHGANFLMTHFPIRLLLNSYSLFVRAKRVPPRARRGSQRSNHGADGRQTIGTRTTSRSSQKVTALLKSAKQRMRSLRKPVQKALMTLKLIHSSRIAITQDTRSSIAI